MAIAEVHSTEQNQKNEFAGIKGLKANSLMIFFSGLVILVSAILVFLMIVQNVFGNFTLTEILPTKANIQYQPEEQKIALLYSTYTENMMDDGNTWVQDNLDTWMNFLRKFNISYDVITDIEVEDGKHFEYDLLVLAGAKSLSDKEISQIKKFSDNGGSIFASSGIGTYSDEGKWKGWKFYTELFGMIFTKELIPEHAETKVHTLRGNLPITAGIPTGYSLQIATWDRPIYSQIIEPRTNQVSYWFDYRNEKGLVIEEIKKSAGITYGTYGKGRFVWFGFEINSIIGSQRDHIYFGRIFQNCINWLSYRPTAMIKDWPEPYNAAAVFIPTFENNFNNLESINSLIAKYKYPVSFLVNSELILNSNFKTKKLLKNINVDPIINYKYDTSSRNILRDSLSNITGKTSNGMQVKNYITPNLIKKITEENYTYIITDSLIDRSVPKKIVMDEKPVYLISKTVRDDKKVIGEYGLTNLEFQNFTYKEDIDRILFEGGLYVMKFNNEYQLSNHYIPVLKETIDYIRSENIWFTSLPNLVKWWQKQSGIELRYDIRSKRRISVEVSNHEEIKTDDFMVQIFLNKGIYNIQISADMIHTPIPEFEFDSGQNILYLNIGDLEADETRTFLIDFENKTDING